MWEIFVPGVERRRALQVRDQGPQRRDAAAQGRSGRLLRRAAAGHRLDRLRPRAYAWNDHGLDGSARATTNTAAHADLDLRGPSRLVAAHARGGQPLPHLSRAGRPSWSPYVQDMGFTHVELMPITEHPFDGSWGYQPTGLFAPTSRYGTPDDLRGLVDALSPGRDRRDPRLGAGPFPDRSAWARPLRRHPSLRARRPGQGRHVDWDTLIYNYGRNEVANFLLSSAMFWLDRFHIDGLRVDAVASMLYRDYSRQPGEWVPKCYGGRENLEAIDFLRRFNELVYGEVSRRDDGRRGIDRVADGVAPGRRRRPRLRLQMEHGLDARHARLSRRTIRSIAASTTTS